jgi:hypothetical protein
VCLQLFVLRVDPAVSVGIPRAFEFPTVSFRKHTDEGEHLLQSCGHDERIKACWARQANLYEMGGRGVTFWCHLGSVTGALLCISVHFSHIKDGFRPSQCLGRFCAFLRLLGVVYGGEGEIRTPDSLTTMPDFESGAFNRALPPLR